MNLELRKNAEYSNRNKFKVSTKPILEYVKFIRDDKRIM